MDESRIEVVTELYKKMHKENPGKPLGLGWNSRNNADLCYDAVGDQVDRVLEAKGSVLDVGCGYGYLYGFLKNQYILGSATYLGIDPNELAIEEAKKRFPNGEFQLGDHTTIDKTYDVVVGVGTLSFYDMSEGAVITRAMWDHTGRMMVLVWNNMTTDIGEPAVFTSWIGCDSWSLHHDFSAEHYMMVLNK